MSLSDLSIKSGPSLPPVWNGNPETLTGTVFAIGQAQKTKYIPGHKGRPIPDEWDDGNPKMQYVFYVVGESGKVVRMFASRVSPEKEAGTAWKAWTDAVTNLGSEDFSILFGRTFKFRVKTTMKPGGKEVLLREWFPLEELPGVSYTDNIIEDWQHLPGGVLETFYYPGYSPEEMKAAKNAEPAAAPAAAVASPAPAEEGPGPSVYDEDIPF